MNNLTTKQYSVINIILYILTLAVNFLGASGYINGMTQKAVSDKYLTLITPAPFTFSIWGLIYVLVIIGLIWLLVKNGEPQAASMTKVISKLFWLTCIFDIFWIISFSYEWMLVSVLLIAVFLLSLTRITLAIRNEKDSSLKQFMGLTFGVFTGWLTIATVVNISAFLVSIGWNGFGISAQTLAVITLVAALVVVAYVQSQLRNPLVSLTVAWAMLGIYNFLRSADGFGGQYALLQTAVLITMGILVLLAVIRFAVRNKNKIFPATD